MARLANIITPLTIGLLPASLSSCSFELTKRAYEGPARSRADVAWIEFDDDTQGLWLYRVGGDEGGRLLPQVLFPLEMLPGEHVLFHVRVEGDDTKRESIELIASSALPISCAAGGSYSVCPVPVPFLGSVYCIRDAVGGQIVSVPRRLSDGEATELTRVLTEWEALLHNES